MKYVEYHFREKYKDCFNLVTDAELKLVDHRAIPSESKYEHLELTINLGASAYGLEVAPTTNNGVTLRVDGAIEVGILLRMLRDVVRELEANDRSERDKR